MEKGFEKLEIDHEFKTLIQPLRKDEYRQLEVNLTIDGCREPIITWNDLIIDGHNRYEICKSYRETRKEFMEKGEEPVTVKQERLPLIKVMPKHDPDAELAGLTLTVPSWISSIERARNHTVMNAASADARSKLEEALLALREKITEMLLDIREVH